MDTTARLAPRLNQLQGANIAVLDCGKRGGSDILSAVGHDLKAAHGAKVSSFAKKSAHSMASKKLIEELSEGYDSVVYGVVN